MPTLERTRDEDLWRHATTHQPVSDCPLLDGNEITLLPSGADTIAAMFDALERARDHIHLEYYIFDNVHLQGRCLLDLLLAARGRGVEIAIIYDSVGSLHTPDEFFRTLAAAKVQILEFHPVNPLRKHFVWHLNDRDHRKIMLIDGQVAFIGGVNLSRVYENPPEAGTPPAAKNGYWHDCAIRIRGPLVAQAQGLFLDTWRRHGGDALAPCELYPDLDSPGDQVARLEGSLPHERRQLYFHGMQTAIQNAQHRILLTTGYFVPARREWQMLADAARRGVSVDLILAGYSDVGGALHAARALYGRLLDAGVRIHELTDGFLHAKAATIDGVWTAIGSSNFDRRSKQFNNEVDAVILGRDTASDIEALLEGWMSRATLVTLKAWRQRSWREHVDELSARLWERYM
jgi:cardiolipin synthase